MIRKSLTHFTKTLSTQRIKNGYRMTLLVVAFLIRSKEHIIKYYYKWTAKIIKRVN